MKRTIGRCSYCGKDVEAWSVTLVTGDQMRGFCEQCKERGPARERRIQVNKAHLEARGWKVSSSKCRCVDAVIYGSPRRVPQDAWGMYSNRTTGRWDDHGRLYYRRADKEYMYVSEPYDIELDTLKELVALCDHYALQLWIHPAAVHNPDGCTAIWIVRQGVSFVKPDTE